MNCSLVADLGRVQLAAQHIKTMETAENLKLEIKKLSSQALNAKMDLHDLSEELPAGWERIMEVAEIAAQRYAKLSEAKKRLKELEG